MNPVRVIEAKRDGRSLDRPSLEAFFGGYLRGEVEEYQVSALLMAILFRGMEDEEIAALVDVMIHSGAILPTAGLRGPVVDKHSTGGVGDKVSLVLAPLAAEAGISVPMMAGRGLGHTGGTLDKLESIPGFRTDLSLDAFLEAVAEEGAAIVGQSEEIAPLDRRLYALRSVTATVPSIPLIAASIMSKKLAEGLDGLVLDVKVGAGAFLPDEERATELARTMVALGTSHGVETVALLTAMDRPLGRTVGNAVEVREALDCLRGGGPDELRAVVLALAGEMLAVGGGADAPEPGSRRARELLDSGRALERFRRIVDRQGGDPRVLDDPDRLPRAPVVEEVRAGDGGTVEEVSPVPLGRAVVELGGGRLRLGQEIDFGVGFDRLVAPGDELEPGGLLGRVHARTRDEAPLAVAALRSAVRVAGDEPRAGEGRAVPLPLVVRRISPSG